VRRGFTTSSHPGPTAVPNILKLSYGDVHFVVGGDLVRAEVCPERKEDLM
jgi:hypothetical protein